MPRTTVMDPDCACCGRTFGGRGNARVARSADVQHLCDVCNEEALDLNAHSDGHHDDAPSETCFQCNGQDPHAGFGTPAAPTAETVTREGAGRVAREDDGRLRANAPVIPENAKRVRITLQKGEVTRYAGMTGSVVLTQAFSGVDYCKVKIDGKGQVRWFLPSDLKKTTVALPTA